MKKLIFSIVALATLTISCSKSDNDPANEQLPFTVQNLAGVWYIKEFIKLDNTATPYKKVGCATKRDFVTFGFDRSIESTIHLPNCNFGDLYPSLSYSFNDGSNEMIGCHQYYGGVATITRSTLRIDYKLTNDVREMNGNTPVKAIILTRQ